MKIKIIEIPSMGLRITVEQLKPKQQAMFSSFELNAILDHYGCRLTELRNGARSNKLFHCRRLVALWLYDKGITRSEIGRILHKDHSTIAYYINYDTIRSKQSKRTTPDNVASQQADGSPHGNQQPAS